MKGKRAVTNTASSAIGQPLCLPGYRPHLVVDDPAAPAEHAAVTLEASRRVAPWAEMLWFRRVSGVPTEESRGGGTHFRMAVIIIKTLDPRTPTMSGRSTSGFHRQGGHRGLQARARGGGRLHTVRSCVAIEASEEGVLISRIAEVVLL